MTGDPAIADVEQMKNSGDSGERQERAEPRKSAGQIENGANPAEKGAVGGQHFQFDRGLVGFEIQERANPGGLLGERMKTALAEPGLMASNQVPAGRAGVVEEQPRLSI